MQIVWMRLSAGPAVTQRQSFTADHPPAFQHPLKCGCHADALLVVTSSRERETLPRFLPLKKARYQGGGRGGASTSTNKCSPADDAGASFSFS